MSMKTFQQIDKFYFILGITIIFLALLLYFTFSAIIGSLATAKQTDEELSRPEIFIKTDDINKAYEEAFKKNNMPLDL